MRVYARCPGCGAGVEVPTGVDAVTCSRCSATSQIARAPSTPRGPAGRPVIVVADAPETPLGVAAGAALVALGFAVAGAVQVQYALRGEAWLWLGAAVFLGIAALAAGAGVHYTRLAARRQRVLASGLPGEARITSLELAVEDGEHAGRLHLAIELPERASVAARVEEKIPALLVPMLLEGVMLPVRVDPEEPSFAVVEWDVAASRVGPTD